MTWTGTEKFDCYCGMPAAVIKQEDGHYLMCFAHSRESALMAILPKERPADLPEETVNRDEIKSLIAGGADKTHPTLEAWVARRQYIYTLIRQGFEEAHPEIGVYVSLYKEKGASSSEVLEAWKGLEDDEVRQYVLNAAKCAPEGVTDVYDHFED